LVALDREQVSAALFDDLAAHVTLAEHRIAEDDATLDGQDTQQLQGGLVFVGLGRARICRRTAWCSWA
jgi:hypothetical protein